MADSIPFDIRPEAQKIEVFPTNQGIPSQNNATARSLKYHYALGEDSPGVDSLYNSIISGQEETIRNKQAMQQSLKDKQYQLERLNGYLANHAGPITEQALANFQTLTAPREPNPKIDMEKEFSSKLVDELYFGDDSIVKQAGLTRPMSQFYNVFKDNLTKQELVRKTLEDTNKDYEKPYSLARKNKSWWDDALETMVPLKSWIDIASNSDSGKLFLGANLADVVRKGAMMTADQFEPWFRGQYDAIAAHNPLDAQHFAEAFLSYSQSSEAWDTFGNLADITSVVPSTLALKGVRSAFKGTTAVLGKMKGFDIPSIFASAGRTEEAAKSVVIKDIKQNYAEYEKALGEVSSLDQQGDVKRLIGQLPTFSNPLKFVEGGSIREVPNAPPVKPTEIQSFDNLKIDYVKGPESQQQVSLGDGLYAINSQVAEVPIKKKSPYNIFKSRRSDSYGIYYNQHRIGHVDAGYDMNDGELLYIKDIRITHPEERPGTKVMRDLLYDFVRKEFPNAKYVGGLRVSGARELAGSVDETGHMAVKIPTKKSKATPEPVRFTAGFLEEGKLGTQNVKAGIQNDLEVAPRLATPEPNLIREFSNRIGNRLLEQGIPALNGLADRNAVERLSRQAEQVAIQRAVDFARLEYNHLGDGVVDLAHYLPPESNIANIGQVAIYLKRPNALPFESEQSARMWAETEYKLAQGSYDIQNQGNSWYIRVIRPIDETDPLVRNSLIETGNETKRNFLNTFFGNLRSADDVNPTDLRTGRKVAVHAIQDQYRALEEMTTPIRALKGQSKKDFIRFTEALRDYENQGIRGRFFNTMREMETEWQNMFGRLPNEKEIVAYNSYLRAYEWDYMWRNIGVYRSLTRQGIRDFKITKPDGTMTSAFKGRQVDNINWNNNDGLLVQGQTPYFARAGTIPAEERNALDVSISNGEYKVIQLAQPQMLPLKAELEINDLVEFVLVKNFTSDRIELNQIPFKPGGHALYDYNHFIKQPRAMWAGQRRLYTHDTTVRPLSFSSDANRLVPLYNEAQRLYRLRDPGFDAYVNANIPEGAARLRSAFEDGSLSTDEPFVAVKRGQSAWNIGEVKNHYNAQGGVENYQSSANNLYQSVNHQYAGERNYDVATGNGRGSEENPLFRLDRPKYIDPLTTVNRAMATLARNQSLEDFRFLAAEHFAQEFQGALAASQDQLRSNPIAALFQPKWNESAPRDLLQAAKHYQRSFVDFMHVQTDWGKNVGWLKERIYEWTSHRIGEARTDAIANSKLLKSIQDPIHTIRSLAFVEHLGLFNPMQYFKQLQTLTHLTGIAGPVIAGKSVPAAYMMRALMMTAESPAHVAQFAKMAAPFGWTREMFEEAYQGLRRTGLDIVEGEHAWKDDLSDPDLFTGKFTKFLNKTTFFFKEGERQTRISSFNAAYLQWKQANPTATLDRRALQSILTRQDIMNGNMTRASNAAWQSMAGGVLSVPLQFATYPIRIMEQFMSSRLTPAERFRLISTYSLMYGIPVGVGITPLGVYPWYQDLTQHLLENGIVEDPNPVVETLHKGLIEMIFHMVGGKEYAAGESLGVGGLQITKDMLNGQFMEVALGASGSTIGGIFESTIPLFHDLAGIFNDGQVPLITADFMDVMRNASSVNSAYKMYYALAYGKYVSRGETTVDQMTPIDAIFSTIFGVNPQSFDNLSREIDSMKDQKAAQDHAEKQMIKYIRRGLQTDPRDTKTREAYFRQAQTWRVLGDFQYDQFPKILQRALAGIEPLAAQINNSYFWRNAPASQMKAREDALIKMYGAKPVEPSKIPLPPPQTALPAVLGIRG